MKQDSTVGELLGEFFGTMILILFGVGVVASVVAAGVGDHDSITWAWGFGVTLGVYTAARLSGAHLNPAVTIALAAFKGFSWGKVGPYCLAQTAGAFVAAHHRAVHLRRLHQRPRPGPHLPDAGHLLDVAGCQRRRPAPRSA